MYEVKVKRVYDGWSSDDGRRVLVDRLWPRGVRKSDACDLWLKAVAPSAVLRRWFHAYPEQFSEFAARFEGELRASEEAQAALLALAEEAIKGPVTLLTAATSTRNHATLLRTWVAQRAEGHGTAGAKLSPRPGGPSPGSP